MYPDPTPYSPELQEAQLKANRDHDQAEVGDSITNYFVSIFKNKWFGLLVGLILSAVLILWLNKLSA